MDAGTTLFHLAGSGDHSDVGDDERKRVPGAANQMLEEREEVRLRIEVSSIDMYNNDVSKN